MSISVNLGGLGFLTEVSTPDAIAEALLGLVDRVAGR